ncbi:MAG: GNAT family N-acetyltransferase [Burkholderiales bacterium]
MLHTARLRLRPPTLLDASALFECYARDPEVARFMTWRPHRSARNTQAYLRRLLQAWQRGTSQPWVITARASGRPLGLIELRPSGHRAEIGYVLGRPWWGQGFMTEAAGAVVDWALEHPTIHRVWAVTDVDNRASARVLEKTGMTREGRLRAWLIHPNLSPEPRDCWCYARIRS